MADPSLVIWDRSADPVTVLFPCQSSISFGTGLTQGTGPTHFPLGRLPTSALREAAWMFTGVPVIRISVGVMSFLL